MADPKKANELKAALAKLKAEKDFRAEIEANVDNMWVDVGEAWVFTGVPRAPDFGRDNVVVPRAPDPSLGNRQPEGRPRGSRDPTEPLPSAPATAAGPRLWSGTTAAPAGPTIWRIAGTPSRAGR
jgi:hypothetical protein